MTDSTASAGPRPGTAKGMAYRYRLVDLFKVILAIMVVGLHVPLGTDLLPRAGFVLDQSIYRIAVPAFFCLTGYFLSPSLGQAWQRRVWRFLLLYLLWMAIYAPFWLDDVIGQDGVITNAIKMAVFGYWHLWYLFALCLALPLLALMARWRTATLLPFAIALLLIGLTLQYGSALTHSRDTLPLSVYRNGLFAGLPFLILGHLLRRHNLPQVTAPGHLAALAATGMALLVAEAVAGEYLGLGSPSDLRLSLLLAVPALVALALSLADHPLGQGLPAGLGTMATGIYLIHPGVISIANKLALAPSTLLTIAIILLSAAATWTCVKLRLARFLF